uniref:Aminotransferase-like plant mobile domain-containing protein n=1 Tax=Fagus sylvatica TaxID=28930 RepID=A0A2N9I020_FAGSY
MDWALITALVERWRQETHTFHLPHGEMTITLQDVELLGVSPPPNKLDGSRLNMKWLQDTFGVLPDDVNEVTVQRYTRVYILELLGGSYFADKSAKKVHLMFLPMLEDFDAARRFPHISPAIKSIQPIVNAVDDANANADVDVDADADAAQPLLGGPYGTRQRPDQVIWQPYTDDVLSSLPEYCRIGQEQDIPQPVNTDVKLHDCDLRGKTLCNMRICEMFHPEQELDPAKFMELAAEAYQLAFNALEASNELHQLNSVERVNTDLDTGTDTTVPPTAPRRRRPRAQRPPRPRVTPSLSTHIGGPSLPTQSVGPSSRTQSVVPTSATQLGGPASATQLGGLASAMHQSIGPSSATQLEDLVGDIDVGDHGRGRGRGLHTTIVETALWCWSSSRLSGFDPPPARLFGLRVLDLKEQGVSEEEAMVVADMEYCAEKKAKKKAYVRLKQIARLEGKKPPPNPYPSAIKEIQVEERKYVRDRFFNPKILGSRKFFQSESRTGQANGAWRDRAAAAAAAVAGVSGAVGTVGGEVVAFALRSRGFTVSGFQLLGFLSLSLTLCLSLQLFRKIWDFFCFVQARCTHTARGCAAHTLAISRAAPAKILEIVQKLKEERAAGYRTDSEGVARNLILLLEHKCSDILYFWILSSNNT